MNHFRRKMMIALVCAALDGEMPGLPGADVEIPGGCQAFGIVVRKENVRC